MPDGCLHKSCYPSRIHHQNRYRGLRDTHLDGGVEVGYRLALTNETKLKPLGTFDFEWSGHNGATETGAGSHNASVASESRWQADAGIDLEVEHSTKLASGANVIWKARAL